MEELEIEKFPEFDSHKLVSFMHDKNLKLHGFIAIHRGGINNPSLGATRLWKYESDTEELRDALRLSRIMSYKSAMAGIKYGGAKGVLFDSGLNQKERVEMFKSYANRINYFGGKFVTGTDVGLMQDDIKVMRKETPYEIG